jgi:ribosomal protein S12 methylthiotransferase accessory factor
MIDPWFSSRYTGLFTAFGRVAPRPHDPALVVFGGILPGGRGGRSQALPVGGIGVDEESAIGACIGEAVERFEPYPLADDACREASWEHWDLSEKAVAPEAWVLFHPEQYRSPGFPFRPFTRATRCRWIPFRDAVSGDPWWVPAEMGYLFLGPGERHQLAPSISTGLSCGRKGDPVLLRGLQEVIERDAAVGAWWGRYPLEEWDQASVLDALAARDLAWRLLRPNLTYRFYRVLSPFTDHATLVTITGEDREGFCFATGTACREDRDSAWVRAMLEAVQSWIYVRHLQAERRRDHAGDRGDGPVDFAGHAVYYSCHAGELASTVLARAARAVGEPADDRGRREDLRALVERLGPAHPVLFRNLTPPGLAAELGDLYVLRVVVPGLQPLHGDHRIPFLGGPIWAPRSLDDWAGQPPHPFA